MRLKWPANCQIAIGYTLKAGQSVNSSSWQKLANALIMLDYLLKTSVQRTKSAPP